VIIFPVIIYVVSWFISPVIISKTIVRNLFLFSLFLSAIFLTLAAVLYRKRTTKAKQPASGLVDKLQKYKSALVVFLAFNEAPAFLSALFYMLTREYLFLIIAGIILINILLKRPDKSRIFNELELNTSEQMELN